MANIRMIPPADGNHGTITIRTRVYTCAAGATIDVPDFDANVMMANGWTASATGGVGATAARPTAPKTGQQFLDTTVGKIVVWDGKAWRDHVDGSAA
jgi:hypothetical protein